MTLLKVGVEELYIEHCPERIVSQRFDTLNNLQLPGETAQKGKQEYYYHRLIQ